MLSQKSRTAPTPTLENVYGNRTMVGGSFSQNICSWLFVWQIFRYLQSLVVVNVTVPERESSTLVETYIRSI